MNEYKTSDIFLAATLCCLRHTMIDIDRADERRAVFIFLDTPILHENISDFWEKKLLVEPQSLFTELKFIKNRLYSTM